MSKKDAVHVAMTTLETTVGELVEIITQIALDAGKTEQEGYELASATLESIMKRRVRTEALPN
jgi:hypothetical protein